MTFLDAVDYLFFGILTDKFENVITAYQASENDEDSTEADESIADEGSAATDVSPANASITSLRHMRRHSLLPECSEKDRHGSASSRPSYRAPVRRGEKTKEGGTEKPSTPKTVAFIPIPKNLPKDPESRNLRLCKVPLPKKLPKDAESQNLRPCEVHLHSAEKARGDNEIQRSKIPDHIPEIDKLPVPKVVFIDKEIRNTFDEQRMDWFCGSTCQGVMDTITAFDKLIGGYLTAMDETIPNDTSKTTDKSPSEKFWRGSSNSSMGRRDESSSPYFPKIHDRDSAASVNDADSRDPVLDDSQKRSTARTESTTRICNKFFLEENGGGKQAKQHILKRRRSKRESDTIQAVCSEDKLNVRRSPYLITRERSNQSRSSISTRGTRRSKNLVTKASCGAPLVVDIL